MLNLNALRQSLVALPQDPMFLAGTVRYNLDPLGKSPDDDIWDALDKMGIREVIEKRGGLDGELNTGLAERRPETALLPCAGDAAE